MRDIDQTFKQYFESDEFIQWADGFMMDVAIMYKVPLHMLVGKDKAEEMINRSNTHVRINAHNTNNL